MSFFSRPAPYRLVRLLGVAALCAALPSTVCATALAEAPPAPLEYDPTEFRIPANDPVPAATVAAAIGGGVTADRIADARYSADHARILFMLEGTHATSADDDTVQVMRADGSQRTELATSSAYYSWEENAYWVDADTVTWRHTSPYLHGSSFQAWKTVAAAGAVDTWKTEPAAGYDTLDGRYRVDLSLHWTYPGGAAMPIFVTVLSTGKQYAAKTPRWYQDPVTHWHPACRMPDGSAPPETLSVPAALRGPNPICDFSRPPPEPSPVPSPTPAPTPTPTPVATATPNPQPTATPAITASSTPAPAPGPGPSPTPPPVTPLTQPVPLVTIVRFTRDLDVARTKGLRLRLGNTGAVSAKVWLLGKGGTLASRSIPKLAPGAISIALPRAPRLGKTRTSVTIRVAAIDASGKRTTVERTAELVP